MADGEFYIEIAESDEKIKQLIRKAMAEALTEHFKKSADKIDSIVVAELREAITRQPEWSNIQAGPLRLELGLPDPTRRLNEILEAVLGNIRTIIRTVKPVGDGFSSGIIIEAIESGYGDLIGLGAANLTTEKGENLPWLEWLLLRGTSPIIIDYHVVFIVGKGRARRDDTEGALMFHKGTWSMPIEFAGTESNNFISRAVTIAVPKIEEGIRKCLISS